MDAEWTFLSADVELTDHCNEYCAMCPRKQLRRPYGLMPREVFDRVLEVLVQFRSRVTFSGLGNPTLHPSWARWLSRVREAGLPAGLVLHASEITPNILDLLEKYPPSHLEISFPSIDPSFFARLCPHADFDQALENVLQLHRKAIAPLVCVGLETGDCAGSAKAFRTFWKSHGIRSRFFPCHSRGGNLQDLSLVTATPSPSLSCGLLAVHAFIAWNGDLLACCHDLKGETRFGNLLQDDPLALARKKAHHAANGPPWSICQNCDEFRKGWALPQGDCPQDPALRAAQLRRATAGRGK